MVEAKEIVKAIDAIVKDLLSLKRALSIGGVMEAAPGFEEFWKLYPKRIDYGGAETAWKQTVRQTDVPLIMSALKHARWPENHRYIPWPSRWLANKRWLDTPVKEHHGKYEGLSERV